VRVQTVTGRDLMDSMVLEIHLSRVFVLRIWLGTKLLHLAMWVIGGHAQVIPRE
jgi:hypothetical protein